MTEEKRLLQILLAITHISNERKLAFNEKLQEVLLAVVECMEARRGSIMLLKGRKALEVVASTNQRIVGLRQLLDEASPSGWVVKHKVPLYVDKNTEAQSFKSKEGTYEKSAFLVVPILRGEKVTGVLSVTDKVGPDVFAKEEQETLLEITGQLIGALETERLARSLQKSKKTLNNRNRQLKKLEKLRTELFNMLVHDLKGPISEVVSSLDILSYTVTDENRSLVEAAQTGCDTLERMVANLLDIARLEERRLELIYERIDPEDLINEALGRFYRLSQTKDLTFVKDVPSSQAEPHFSADRGVLLRVLQNLLTNAIHYSPNGETIEVGFSVDHSRIRFHVKDQGPGVPSEHHEVIFDKFMQLEKKRDGRIYTTGLGLTFCRMAVQAHHGKIGVENVTPHGSLFWFTLPLELRRGTSSAL